MTLIRRLLASLGMVLFSCRVFARPGKPADFPLSQVRPGLRGVGRTIFQGDRIDEFQVEILGVLKNALAPQRSLILARLSGGPLATTGVISGMSGSPVYINGKLMGAVSRSFPLSKEPIAGITPIEEMLTVVPSAPIAAASALPNDTYRIANTYGGYRPARPAARTLRRGPRRRERRPVPANRAGSTRRRRMARAVWGAPA